MKLSRFAILIAALFCIGPSSVHAQGYVEREVMIPWVSAGPNGLDVLEVYFDAPGKHPLVVMTHGSSRKPEEHATVTPWAQLPQALWFARRGWFVLVVVRRGYGRSGGEQDGKHAGHCPTPDYQAGAEYSAVDLREAVEYARTLPQVDATKAIAVGVSTGGLATVALTADPPPGLAAGINFAGGRGSRGDHDVCDPGDLIQSYKNFGKRSRVPMLWIYAQNDKFFWPELAEKFDAAFKSGGGQDEFVLAPAIGDDGHSLFRHPEAWSETVSAFLNAHNLAPLAELYPEIRTPNVEPPAGLGENGLEAFHSYLLLGPHKAFAKSEHGFGYATAKIRVEDARNAALENCKHASASGDACAVVNVDNAPVN